MTAIIQSPLHCSCDCLLVAINESVSWAYSEVPPLSPSAGWVSKGLASVCFAASSCSAAPASGGPWPNFSSTSCRGEHTQAFRSQSDYGRVF